MVWSAPFYQNSSGVIWSIQGNSGSQHYVFNSDDGQTWTYSSDQSLDIDMVSKGVAAKIKGGKAKSVVYVGEGTGGIYDTSLINNPNPVNYSNFSTVGHDVTYM